MSVLGVHLGATNFRATVQSEFQSVWRCRIPLWTLKTCQLILLHRVFIPNLAYTCTPAHQHTSSLSCFEDDPTSRLLQRSFHEILGIGKYDKILSIPWLAGISTSSRRKRLGRRMRQDMVTTMRCSPSMNSRLHLMSPALIRVMLCLHLLSRHFHPGTWTPTTMAAVQSQASLSHGAPGL